MPDHFFFYGTLIPQFSPLHLREILSKLRIVGEGSARGVYDLGAYPGAVFDEKPQTKVFGRVFQGEADRLLAALDRYEGYDSSSPETSEYVRKRLPITLETGETIDCWAYEYNGSLAAATVVPDGRYTPRASDN
jgi:gamma-glutamylcyclotransferase (GGCT)/AIG2-like uncharacterized protein YtfP